MEASRVETRETGDDAMRVPNVRMRITPRAVGTIFLVGLVFAAGVAAFIGSMRFVALLWPVIRFLLFAAFLAVLLNPVVGWLTRHRIRRGLAIAIVLVALLAIVPLLAAIILPRLISQVNELVSTLTAAAQQPTGSLGTVVSFAEEHGFAGYVTTLRDQVAQGLPTVVARLFGALISLVTGFVSHFTVLLLLLFVLFLLLSDGEGFVEKAIEHFSTSAQPRLRRFLSQSAAAFYHYLGGKLVLSLICAAAVYIVLLILQIPAPLPLALIVGLFDLVPLVGAIIAGFVVAIVGLLQSPIDGIILVIYFFIYQQVEDTVLQPLVFGRTNRLHPLAVVVAILIGIVLFGVLGAILAIPTAEIIRLGYDELRGNTPDSGGEQPAASSEQPEPDEHHGSMDGTLPTSHG
jgi:predicted PurR-regulated permease PerM